MTFRSVNLNPPRGPRGGSSRGGGGSFRGGNSGYNTPPVRINQSGLVDQGFGPVGGASGAMDADLDIFGLDDFSNTQPQQAASSQPIFGNAAPSNYSAPRGRGRGRGTYNNQSQRDGFQSMDIGDNPEIQIRGWDGADNRNDVIAFLLRKFGVQVQNYRFVGTNLFCYAPNPQGYQTLINANGVRFAGKSLQIQQAPPRPTHIHQNQASTQNQTGTFSNQPTQTIYETLKGVLSRRYSGETGLLDLSNLPRDETLQQAGFFNNPSTQAKLFPALMKIASENIPKQGAGIIISVSLAGNGLRDIRGVEGLATAFPDLENLTLEQNNISRPADLDPWSHATKFSKLKALILNGNPIQQIHDYRREVAQRFQSLESLDGSPLTLLDKGTMQFGITPTNTAISTTQELPGKVRQGVWGDGSSEIGVGFLGVFFQLFDSDRHALVQRYYTPTTLFSLSVDTGTPHQPTHHRRGAFSGANQPSSSANMGNYIPQSRNLQRTTHINARTVRLHHGRDQIAQAFINFPRTRHPIDDPAAFVADGFQVQIGNSGGIMVSVHGEFYEVGDRVEIRRSFDRTFLLGPPAPTNPESPCVVVSDLLVLRPWSGRDAWVPEESNVAQGLIQELRRRTGLNERFAGILLQESNGDIEAGVAKFEQAKASNTIPPEAFQ